MITALCLLPQSWHLANLYFPEKLAPNLVSQIP